MKLRKANEKDILGIMKIIGEAQKYFKNNGIDQWQNNYPNEETIKNDIENNESYVLTDDNKIIATTALSFRGESTYDNIYEGNWISKDDFAVIHRIAVDSNFKGTGIASRVLEDVEKICKEKSIYSIKIDTHEDNISMQKLLEKNEFKYCGIIYLQDNNKRIAFEKVLK